VVVFFYSKGRQYYSRNDSAKYSKAYEMRHNPTRAEACMWDILRTEVRQSFPNHIFRRQYVQYGYILDFYCPALRLGIEVDGYVHDDQKEYDWHRDNALAQHGIQIFRFSNDDVLYSTRAVASELCRIIGEKNKTRGFVAVPEQITTAGQTIPEYQTNVSYTLQTKTNRSCFIATAAYGTTTAKELNVLRNFRDAELKSNLVGSRLVDLYYFTSPPIANIIARSKEMRAFVRKCLDPIINSLKRKGY